MEQPQELRKTILHEIHDSTKEILNRIELIEHIINEQQEQIITLFKRQYEFMKEQEDKINIPTVKAPTKLTRANSSRKILTP